MAEQGIISPQRNKLLEKTIDGASLIYDSVEAHNCEQLKRWLKCHGRPQKGKKSELIERLDIDICLLSKNLKKEINIYNFILINNVN